MRLRCSKCKRWALKTCWLDSTVCYVGILLIVGHRFWTFIVVNLDCCICTRLCTCISEVIDNHSFVVLALGKSFVARKWGAIMECSPPFSFLVCLSVVRFFSIRLWVFTELLLWMSLSSFIRNVVRKVLSNGLFLLADCLLLNSLFLLVKVMMGPCRRAPGMISCFFFRRRGQVALYRSCESFSVMLFCSYKKGTAMSSFFRVTR